MGCTLLLRRRAESTRLKQSPTLSLSRSPLQALTRADIEPALAQLKRKLMERNVAEEIADK